MKKAYSVTVLIAETSLSFISLTRELFLYPLVLMDGFGILDSFSLMRKVNPAIMIQIFIIISIIGVICKVWQKEDTVKNTEKDYISIASTILAIIFLLVGISRCNLYSVLTGLSIKVILLFVSYFTYFKTIISTQTKIIVSVLEKIINTIVK